MLEFPLGHALKYVSHPAGKRGRSGEGRKEMEAEDSFVVKTALAGCWKPFT